MLHDADLVSIQEVRSKVEKAYSAWTKYHSFAQDRIDAIVERMAEAGRANAERLARMAVEETGYGNVKDKIGKNMLCADTLPRAMRGMRTVGVLREIPEKKILEIGVPMGVVAAILPTTNPTSTAIFKILISLKAGNTIVISPHPRAKVCTCETAEVLYRAALEAGAPEEVIQCVTTATLEATNELMRHRRTAVILSTGGSGLVRAAYSSGKPAFGVGPGNVPVLLDTTADVSTAVASIVAGKSFDYGTVCSSEQAVVAERSLREPILAALRANHAHICDAGQTARLAKLLVRPNFSINPDCVGQSPQKIAQMAGFEVPSSAAILVVELGGVGKEHPLSAEKLSPVLSLLFVDSFPAAVDACEGILRFGGLGHTCAIYSTDDARIREYGMRMPAFRVLVNTPTPQGSTGITTNVFPSMTLGCGAIAGNITSDNVGPQHLINIKRVAWVVDRGQTTASAPVRASVDRGEIVAAVERYLSKRGVTAAPETEARKAAPTTELVDRFLASRRAAVSPAQACAIPAPAAAVSGPPAPEIAISDFVCEADVRDAIRAAKKIYVGPKSIVTPSARDLASAHDVLVVARR